MHRRTVLATATAWTAAGLAGCVAGGRVVHEQQESILVEPGMGWTFEITAVDGNGAVSYTVRAEQRFDVYYFTNVEDYDRYQAFVGGDDPGRTPSGHSELTRAAVHNEERDLYEARMPEDGGRMSITVEDTHYFVVDHSNYGMGVPVDEGAEPLDAFVNLTAYDKTLPV